MLMKRFYKRPPGWERETNTRDAAGNLKDPSRPEGACLNPPPLDFVAVSHTGIEATQNFSQGVINAAIEEGWCTISKGQLILHVQPEELTYRIDRMPGRYCCHCGEKLPDDATGELARGHVRAQHAGKMSPDPQNPSGYILTSAYECTLDAKQHEQYRCKDPKTAYHILRALNLRVRSKKGAPRHA